LLITEIFELRNNLMGNSWRTPLFSIRSPAGHSERFSSGVHRLPA